MRKLIAIAALAAALAGCSQPTTIEERPDGSCVQSTTKQLFGLDINSVEYRTECPDDK